MRKLVIITTILVMTLAMVRESRAGIEYPLDLLFSLWDEHRILEKKLGEQVRPALERDNFLKNLKSLLELMTGQLINYDLTTDILNLPEEKKVRADFCFRYKEGITKILGDVHYTVYILYDNDIEEILDSDAFMFDYKMTFNTSPHDYVQTRNFEIFVMKMTEKYRAVVLSDIVRAKYKEYYKLKKVKTRITTQALSDSSFELIATYSDKRVVDEIVFIDYGRVGIVGLLKFDPAGTKKEEDFYEYSLKNGWERVDAIRLEKPMTFLEMLQNYKYYKAVPERRY